MEDVGVIRKYGQDKSSGETVQGVYLSDIIKVIWVRKWMVAGFGVLLGACGFGMALRVKPDFSSQSKFVCQGSGTSRMNELGALASLAGLQAASSGGGDPSAYLPEILDDDEFLEDLILRKWAFHGDSLTLREIWKFQPDKSREDWEYIYLKSTVSALKDGRKIKLSRNKGNGVFVLETAFSDPKLAFQVNEHVLRRLNEYLSHSMLTKAREKRHFIEKRVREIEVELRRDEDDLVAFQQKNRDVTAPTVLLQRARLERAVRMDQEIFLQLKKEFEIAKIDEQNDAPLMEVLSKPAVPIKPSPSKSRFFAPVGLVLGLLIGSLAALGRAWYRKELL